MRRRVFIAMSSTQPGRTDETRRHLHYVLRMGNPEAGTPMLDSVERWNWAARNSDLSRRAGLQPDLPSRYSERDAAAVPQ